MAFSTHFARGPMVNFPNFEQERKNYVDRIRDHIVRRDTGFQILHEHLTLIAMAPLEWLDRGGPLWPERQDPARNPESIGDIHWLMVLNSNRGIEPQPDLSSAIIDQWDLDQIEKSICYETRVETVETLEPISANSLEENKCLRRTNGKCALTQSNKTTVFRFIPFTWTNNVENNNITGELQFGYHLLTGVDLLQTPTPIWSIGQLGSTEKAWNMITVGQDIYEYLILGLGAFEFVERKGARVTLKFCWMPRMTPRFDKPTDMSDVNEVITELKDIDDKGYVAPERYRKEWRSWSNIQAVSGMLVNIDMPGKKDAEMLENVVRVHWGCVLFAALCGGAGFPPFMTGMHLRNRSLQCVAKGSLREVTLEDVKLAADNKRSNAGPKPRPTITLLSDRQKENRRPGPSSGPSSGPTQPSRKALQEK
ncbi:hypothetical protein FLONG3_10717 [Fusarium longipes]|uniref:HNH nuclease domain-containing protein n=1 Tax=Fusarium longipes TaxID=694270 RepID=A0A395RKZ9_9HYPO|nr:hypothetical protein FLONG3_10717 [Fusarium longipes]